MPNYLEISTNPITGRPYGESWYDAARGQENPSAPMDPWYTPAELDAMYNPSALNQLTSEAPKFGTHSIDLSVPTVTPDPNAQMLLALRAEELSQPRYQLPATSYAQQIGGELNQVGDSMYQQALSAALAIAKKQAAFDAARYGMERPDAYRQIQQKLYAQEKPDFGVNSFISAWESREPAYDITSGNVISSPNAADNTPGAVQARQASHIGDLNDFIAGINVDSLGAELAAIAGGGVARGKSAGQLRRETLNQFSAVPQSALEGDAFATFSTPPAGKDGAYKGRIV